MKSLKLTKSRIYLNGVFVGFFLDCFIVYKTEKYILMLERLQFSLEFKIIFFKDKKNMNKHIQSVKDEKIKEIVF